MLPVKSVAQRLSTTSVASMEGLWMLHSILKIPGLSATKFSLCTSPRFSTVLRP